MNKTVYRNSDGQQFVTLVEHEAIVVGLGDEIRLRDHDVVQRNSQLKARKKQLSELNRAHRLLVLEHKELKRQYDEAIRKNRRGYGEALFPIQQALTRSEENAGRLSLELADARALIKRQAGFLRAATGESPNL